MSAACAAIVAIASSTGGDTASAQAVYSPYVLPIFPYRGMYYEPGHGGTGLTLDVDNKGYIFAVFYAYTPEGQPYFYLMEGDYHQQTDKQRLQSGILGTFEATPYISENGQCVGGGCDYKSPKRTATNLHAEIVWTTPRVATLTIGDQVWHLQAGQYKVSDADALEGQWSMVAVVNASQAPASPYKKIGVFGSFALARNTGSVTAADFASVPFLSPDSVVYDLTWVRSPQKSGTTNSVFFALYNPHTGRVDIVFAARSASGIIPSSITPRWAVFPDGPQVMRGRGEYARELPNPRNESTYSVESDVTLVRTYPVTTYVDPDGNIEP